MGGFVVINRDALDHHIVGDPQRFYAWCWLISTACWKPTKYNIGGQTITLGRGQLCASRSQMADAWGWSQSAVERFLTRLQTEQMIGRDTGQGRSIITILNYNKYQDVPDKTGQATGQGSGQPADSQRTAKEQGNKGTSKPNGLQPEGVSDEIWNDFVQHRKRKRALITERVMASIAAEAAEAGWSMSDALAEAVTRNWQTFKASWVEKRDTPQAREKQSPADWLTYCEERVKKWREIGRQSEIEHWEAAAAKARAKLGISIPNLRVVQ